MKDLKAYIESGILELYVLGIASNEEVKEIELLAKIHPEIKNEIEAITTALRNEAKEKVSKPNATIKPMVRAILDFHERLKNGERIQTVPLLNENSKPSDYTNWLHRVDMVADDSDIYAKLLGVTPEAVTAIVWMKYGSPPETHAKEYERFLILQGTCDIVIDEKPFSLVPGNYMSIPLHSTHYVKVTSAIPCKVILQRVAA
ncbi:MAG: hypothetical protein JWO32_623 [Bacteroidetes bacterium]|nr:hypothetical protein [Bacteroidota bacterium]